LKRNQTETDREVPVLILGIGNILMGDEGVGSRVAQFLNERGVPDRVECIDGGTGGMHLLGALQSASTVIIVDATLNKQKPGTIQRLEPRFSKDYPRTLTAHDIGLKDMLDAMYLMGEAPRIILFAVTIPELNEVGLELSPEIENSIPEIAAMVLKEIDSILS